MTLAIIRTGVANLASVLAAFDRLGITPRLVDDPQAVRDAEHVLLPGVGAFGPGMAALSARGLDVALRERVAADRPTMAICLGLQLLCAASEETAGVAGLGIIDGVVRRFVGVKTPQLGWNRVVPDAGMHLDAGYAYFANSYRLAEAPAGWTVARTDHGGAFCAALQRGRVLACQFHPELSGPWGQRLLQRWLEARA